MGDDAGMIAMRDDVGVTASDVTRHHGAELARMSALEYDRYMRQRTAFWARHDIERRSGQTDRTEGGKPTSSGSANNGAQRSAEGVGRSAVAAGTQAVQASLSVLACAPGMSMSDIRITDKRRRELNAKFGTAALRDEALMVIRRGRIAAAHAALSHSTWSQNKTIMRCWFEFCEVSGRDPTEFGVVPYDEAPRPSLLKEEDEALADFSVYVTENPRKAGKVSNTGQTAASYVSHVRTYYEFRLDPPRRVGGCGASGVKDGLGHALRRCLKGLRKRHPSNPQASKKASVLRKHMIAVRGMLDMRDSFSAMVWAFMCVAWQGGRRSGELVRAKARTGAWNPKFDMHRGRLSWDWDAEAGKWRRVRIELGPDKTDPSGEQGHTVYLPFDDSAEINAAAAVAHMLNMDPSPPAENERTALFRDTRPGKEGKPMTYGAMRVFVKALLSRAGMTEEEAGCHSFRRGTATSLAHINAPSYVIKGIGIWGSDAYLGYIDATEAGAMEQAMLAMAEADPSSTLGARGIRRG